MGDKKSDSTKNNKITLWFEVEDTGCGIDPSKWESVFESFEQADPSTTRKHGGTGLGLCIVRNLVNTMGGEIKVAKKDGPGTLMQLYLVLGMPEGGTGKQFEEDFSKQSLMVLLALKGSNGRFITSQWLRNNGVFTWEASEWNGLTQILQQVFKGNTSIEGGCSTSLKLSRFSDARNKNKDQNINDSTILIVVDTSLLDQSTNIWNEQLKFLDRYRKRAKFAWALSHDTTNAIKVELRRRGHLLTVSKPLYKTKMIQILETAIIEERSENLALPNDLHECHEIDPIHFEDVSSDDSSDIEISDSIKDAVSFGGKTRELISASWRPYHQTSYLVTESTREISLAPILQNPHLLLTKDFTNVVNSGITSTGQSICYGHKDDIKQGAINAKAEELHNLAPPLEIVSSEKCNDAIVEINQMHLGEEDSTEHEYLYQFDPDLFNKETSKRNLAEKKWLSVSSILREEQVKKDYSTERPEEVDNNISKRLTNVASGINILHNHYITNREGAEASSKMALNQGALDGLHVLLAEDNPILQRVATKMLEKWGATVMAVGDGMQAVNALKCSFCAEEDSRQTLLQNEGKTQAMKQMQQDQPFDLILMDCQMPKLDGYEATRAIRKLEAGTSSHIPIIAVTAHAMSSDKAKCLEVGMDAYMTKPIDCNLMVSTILDFTKKKVGI